MPRTSKADALVTLDEPVIEGRYAELGEYTVAFETHKADVDPAPLFQGLPDDRCPCPHWGVVLSGRIIFRYPDHDEVFTAGDAYYGAPGHLPLPRRHLSHALPESHSDATGSDMNDYRAIASGRERRRH